MLNSPEHERSEGASHQVDFLRWREILRIGWPIALTMMAAQLMLAIILKPIFSADELSHLDYAYQIWHGQLPVFHDGLLWRDPG